MHSFLAPAIALTNRLRYPRKFLLLSLLFVIPLGLVATLFANRLAMDYEFTQRELAGVTYLRPAMTLLRGLLEQKALTGQVGDSSERFATTQAKIEQALQTLKQTDRQLGNALGTTAVLADIEAMWQQNKAASLEHNSTSYESTINATRRLIAQVGDSSNLILDPALDSYYMMDTVLLKLPENQQLVAELAQTSGQIGATPSGSNVEQFQATTQLGQLEASVANQQRGFFKVREINPQAAAQMNLVASAYFDTIGAFINQLRNTIATPSGSDRSANLAIVSRTTQVGDQLWDQAAMVLEQLLEQRNASVRWYAAISAGVIVLGLGLALYFCLGMYNSMVTTIQRLDLASQRMVSGNMNELVQLDSYDELGDVTRVFNDVASALLAASLQRQAVFESAADGILTLDQDGRITALNSSARAMFGYTQEALQGQPVMLVLPEADAATHSNARAVLEAHHADGSQFPCELTWSSVQNGLLNGSILVARDISELRRAELERAQLQQEVINAQAAALAELSTPLIPISDRLLVMPLVGAIDRQRAERIVDTLLHGVERTRARGVILDVTAVPVVDTFVAETLLRAASGARLLGARLILTGIQPEVAQTLVGIGIDLVNITTLNTLQQGIAYITREFTPRPEKSTRES